MSLYTEKVGFGPLRSRLLTGGLVGAGLGLGNAARTDNGTGGLGHYMSGAMSGAGYGGLIAAAASPANIRAATRAFSAVPAQRAAQGAVQGAARAARPAAQAASAGPRIVSRVGPAGSTVVDRATGDLALRAWGSGSPATAATAAQAPAASGLSGRAWGASGAAPAVAAPAAAKPVYRVRQETQVLGARPAVPATIPAAKRVRTPAPAASAARPATPRQLYSMRADTQVLGARPVASPAAIAPAPDQVPMNPGLMQRMGDWIRARRAPAAAAPAQGPAQGPGLMQRMTGWINARRAPAPAPSAADARWQRLLAETAPTGPATSHRFQPPAAAPAPAPVYRAAPRALDPITEAHARYAPPAAPSSDRAALFAARPNVPTPIAPRTNERFAPRGDVPFPHIPAFGQFDPALFSNAG